MEKLLYICMSMVDNTLCLYMLPCMWSENSFPDFPLPMNETSIFANLDLSMHVYSTCEVLEGDRLDTGRGGCGRNCHACECFWQMSTLLMNCVIACFPKSYKEHLTKL